MRTIRTSRGPRDITPVTLANGHQATITWGDLHREPSVRYQGRGHPYTTPSGTTWRLDPYGDEQVRLTPDMAARIRADEAEVEARLAPQREARAKFEAEVEAEAERQAANRCICGDKIWACVDGQRKLLTGDELASITEGYALGACAAHRGPTVSMSGYPDGDVMGIRVVAHHSYSIKDALKSEGYKYDGCGGWYRNYRDIAEAKAECDRIVTAHGASLPGAKNPK